MSNTYSASSVVPASLALIQAAVEPASAELIERAYRFSDVAHAGQYRDEGAPFIEHPVRVATILWQELGSRDVELTVAALLHDTVEDSECVTGELLDSAFGSRVASLVLDVTKEQVPEEKKPIRDREYLDRLPGLSPDARLLKLADRIDNLRSVLRSTEPGKAQRYLVVSQAEFLPLALQTDQVAARLVTEACDAIERALKTGEL